MRYEQGTWIYKIGCALRTICVDSLQSIHRANRQTRWSQCDGVLAKTLSSLKLYYELLLTLILLRYDFHIWNDEQWMKTTTAAANNNESGEKKTAKKWNDFQFLYIIWIFRWNWMNGNEMGNYSILAFIRFAVFTRQHFQCYTCQLNWVL